MLSASKILVTTVALGVLLLSFWQTRAFAEGSAEVDRTLEAKAREYIATVLPIIDVKPINMKLTSYTWEAAPSDVESPSESFTFNLSTNESNVDAQCEFRGDFMYCCFLRAISGKLFVAKSDEGWVEVVRNLLENDQRQMGFEATRLIHALDNATLEKNQTITYDHMILMTSNKTTYAFHFLSGGVWIDYGYTIDTVSLQWADGRTGETVRDVVLTFGDGAFTSITYDRAQQQTADSVVEIASQPTQAPLPTEMILGVAVLVTIAVVGFVFYSKKRKGSHSQFTQDSVS